MSMERTIVEYFAEHEGYRCGYCKSPDTNFSHGMWAHTMSVEVYQGLIDRGWRRSGHYVYKPTNNLTCCPMYTIRCHALEFKASKSQKKVLKKMNNKSTEGPKGNKERMEHQQMEGIEKGEHLKMEISEIEKPDLLKCVESAENNEGGGTSTSTESASLVVIPEKRGLDPSQKEKRSCENVVTENSKKVENTDNKVKPLQKRREFRLQKRKEKLEKLGKSAEFVNISKEKSLSDLILENDIQVELVSVESQKFQEYFEELHALYRKYQMKIHDDSEDECSAKQFRRFLCDSPLMKTGEYGSHHQLYRKNGKLIAVGVLDILPSCASSVYFYYDPDLTHLSLGTYGALYEIHFVQQLNAEVSNIRYYYMGFYIHSCQKMRYKGNYAPSYLLCPEIYQWTLLDEELKRKLDEQKYMKLCDGEPLPQEVNDVIILQRGRIISYKDYNAKRDTAEIMQYCTLVGGHNARKMLLYRK